jgi:hypothetical protein
MASETSASRVHATTAYSEADRNAPAMAAGSHGQHAPISIKLGRHCRQRGTDDCESHRQSKGAHTIANHDSPHGCVLLIREAPANGGHTGASGSVAGEP